LFKKLVKITKMQIKTDFLGIHLENPLVLVSGILGTTGASLARVVRNGAGAVTSKSVWLKQHAGHPNPTVVDLGGGNLLNAVGLPHGGIEEARIEFENFRKLSKKPLFASIAASTPRELGKTAGAVAKLKPDLIELNISCPNVEDELGRPFACCIDMAGKVTAIVKEKFDNIPLAVKLSPNVANIAEIAKSVEAAGADAITAVNTVGPGMVIDVETAQPILANKFGGLSGPAIRPIAVKAVFEIFAAVKIPIIGMGGVTNGRDAVEMIQAGATLVGIGSAAKDGSEIFGKIAAEIVEFCERKKIKNIADLVGIAHKK
jgi:dihydroorotate dehydrogenase (NAD+) catalytic subunit